MPGELRRDLDTERASQDSSRRSSLCAAPKPRARCSTDAFFLETTNPAITFYLFDVFKRAVIPLRHQEHPTPAQTFLSSAFASSIGASPAISVGFR